MSDASEAAAPTFDVLVLEVAIQPTLVVFDGQAVNRIRHFSPDGQEVPPDTLVVAASEWPNVQQRLAEYVEDVKQRLTAQIAAHNNDSS